MSWNFRVPLDFCQKLLLSVAYAMNIQWYFGHYKEFGLLTFDNIYLELRRILWHRGVGVNFLIRKCYLWDLAGLYWNKLPWNEYFVLTLLHVSPKRMFISVLSSSYIEISMQSSPNSSQPCKTKLKIQEFWAEQKKRILLIKICKRAVRLYPEIPLKKWILPIKSLWLKKSMALTFVQPCWLHRHPNRPIFFLT